MYPLTSLVAAFVGCPVPAQLRLELTILIVVAHQKETFVARCHFPATSFAAKRTST
jgi:hypothetical protein